MKTAKLFQNGQSQAVRLPKEFRFDGDEVYVRRSGQAVILLPYATPWQTLVDSLAEFSADYASNDGPVDGSDFAHEAEALLGAPQEGRDLERG